MSWLGKSFKGEVEAGGEVALQLIAFAPVALPEDVGWILSTHTGQLSAACNSSSRRSSALWNSLCSPHTQRNPSACAPQCEN